MKWSTIVVVVATTLSVAARSAPGQDPSTVNLNVPGPADWNVADSWLAPGFGPVVPGDSFPQEVVGISNGGTAVLNAPALFGVQGVVLGETGQFPDGGPEEGTLSLSGSSSLVVTDAFRIGDAGRGAFNFSGGAVSAGSLSVAGDAASALNLSGDAVLAVSADASVDRVTRVEGPDVVFEVEGDLQVGGTFIPVITGPSHSTITVATGSANLGGTIRPEFSGYTPTIGDTWKLIDADSVSGVFNFDAGQAPAATRGVVFDVSYDRGGSGDVELSLSNRLILTVDRASGAAAIENAVGDPIEIEAYIIGSSAGALNPADGAWQSLQDSGLGAWDEANPSMNFLSELNPMSSTSIVAGASLDLGTPYNFQPTQLGQTDELVFRYGVPGDGEFVGLVEVTGPRNNLVLFVDPATGEAAIQNESSLSADIEYYRIHSPSGSLLPGDGNWESLDDQMFGDWDEANPTANNLVELNPISSTVLNTDDILGVGNPFDVNGMQDLHFEFSLVTGEVIAGIVEYGDIPIPPMGQAGDTDGNGTVDIDDLNNVRNNFGAMGPADGTLSGDAFPFDGMVDIDDLNGVRNNFGAGPAPVPEPTSFFLLCLAGLLMSNVRSRKSR